MSRTDAALSEGVRRSIERWLEALARPDDDACLARAVTEDIQISRHDPAPRGAAPGPLAETFVGRAQVGAWLRRRPAAGRFVLVDVRELTSSRAEVTYAFRLDAFVGGGRWLVTLVDDRVHHLIHQPFAIAPS